MKMMIPAIAGAVLATAQLPASAQMTIPTDFQSTCTVTQQQFDSWFGGVAPGAGAPASVAKSSTFTQDNANSGTGPDVCNFYQWGAQMFLWLTSPEGSGLVVDGSSIFNVSPAVDGVRNLIANGDDDAYRLAIRTGKSDDEEIGEVGQAGSQGVLLSQRLSPASGHNALVYYGVHVNDVYGYFLTGQKNGVFTGLNFPSSPDELADVVKYAKDTFSVDLPNSDALVMEMKTSWVAADSVPDKADYVTITAEVPVYAVSADNLTWKPKDTATMELALTGIHIVGTVQDHPEFVWATFEHVWNAPDAAYWYDTDAGPKQWPYSSDGEFLFLKTGTEAFKNNVQCAQGKGVEIVYTPVSKQDPTPACKGGITPSNTIREFPWGSATENTTAIRKNNTLLLSVNASVRGKLAKGDARANYVQTGGVWTTTPDGGGDAPIPDQLHGSKYIATQKRGSLDLANATMETYTMGGDCFGCHQVTHKTKAEGGPVNSFQAFELSHVFSQISKLTPPK